MKLLLIHPNFPGQFLHLARHYSRQAGAEVVGLGEHHAVLSQASKVPGIQLATYRLQRQAHPDTHHYLRGMENHVLRAQAVLRACQGLKARGFEPTVIVVHPGWGDALFLRRIFPATRIVAYMEFYYHPRGKDMGFDPEFPISLDNECELQMKNATHLLSIEECDALWSPTQWQASLFPEAIQKRIRVIHEGVDTQRLKQNPDAEFRLPNGKMLSRDDEVLTLVNRHMEPYRGFHIFMRALPSIQKARPNAEVIIVGSERDVQYSNLPKDGSTWKETLLKEVGSQLDMNRVHFVGALSYEHYLQVLQVSRAHVYMTYPFILSWSMVEAMSTQCLLVASSTPPVSEMICHRHNGLLFDFFDQQALFDMVTSALAEPEQFEGIRAQARKTAVQQFDLSVTLPKLTDFIEGR